MEKTGAEGRGGQTSPRGSESLLQLFTSDPTISATHPVGSQINWRAGQVWGEGGLYVLAWSLSSAQTRYLLGLRGHRTQTNTMYSLLGEENLLRVPELRGSFDPGPSQDPP